MCEYLHYRLYLNIPFLLLARWTDRWTMKKDGIQTRNRKMSTKSKKNKKSCSSAMDLLKPTLERPFGTFSPPSLQHPMHNPMPTYMAGMTGAGGFGTSFMTSQPGNHGGGGLGGGGLGGGLGGGFPSSSLGAGGLGMGGSSGLYTSSGLNLSTNSTHHSMVGAMA